MGTLTLCNCMRTSAGKSQTKLFLSSLLIIAKWVADDHSQPATWSYGVYSNVAYHQSWRTTQVQFQETNQQQTGVIGTGLLLVFPPLVINLVQTKSSEAIL